MTSGIARGLRRTLPLLLLSTLPACGSWSRMGTEPQASPSSTLTSVLDETAIFRRIGRLAAGGAIPFVGNVVVLPGPGDSSLAILALSLENRALDFERQANRGFVARYRVEITVRRDSFPPVTVSREETVRVTTFQETVRNDESVLFQEAIPLLPGQYQVAVTVRDRRGTVSSRAEQALVVRRFEPGTTTAPILIYDVTARGGPAEAFRGLLNPKGAAAYASDTLTVLVEGFRMTPGQRVPISVVDARDSVLLSQVLEFSGATPIESRLLRFVPTDAPLGELRFLLGAGGASGSTTAVVSLSSNWIVANYEEMLSLLRFFGREEHLARLRRATPAERPALWHRFYLDSDPNPATPENEALDAYFARLATAEQRYSDEGQPGWRTERGEVYIVLGDPEETLDASASNQGRVIRWTYSLHRVTLLFVDETGFGRFRLTPSSRSEFERVRARIQRAENH